MAIRRSVDDQDISVSSVTTGDLDVAIDAPNDVAGSRSLGTEEQNTSGKILTVDARLRVSEDIGATNANKQGRIDVRASVDSSSPASANDIVAFSPNEIKLFTDGSGTIVAYDFPLSFIVPDGHFYVIEVVANDFADESIVTWFEREW